MFAIDSNRDCPACGAYHRELRFYCVPYSRTYLTRCPRCRAVLKRRDNAHLREITVGTEAEYREAFPSPRVVHLCLAVAAAVLLLVLLSLGSL